jgi:hypothetical protein
MRRAWLAWLGLFCFLMPLVVQVIMFSHSLNSINPNAPDASMQEAVGSMGMSFSFQSYVGFPIQILGLCMLATWLIRTSNQIADYLAQRGRAAKLQGGNSR